MQNEAKKLILERGNYVPVPQELLTANVSSEAKVLWTWLLSLPNGMQPGRNEAADCLRLNRRTITKAVLELQESNMISVKVGSRSTIKMAILSPLDWSKSAPVDEADWCKNAHSLEQNCTLTGAKLHTHWCKSAHSPYNSIKSIKSINSSSADDQPSTGQWDLEKIYDRYPKKVGKKKGMQRLAKVVTSQSKFDAVLTAIENYKRYCEQEKRGKIYIKQFDTFMSTWEDWLDVAVAEKYEDWT